MNMKNQNEFPVSETIEQMSALEERFLDIGNIGQRDVVAIMECLIPCHCRENKIYSQAYKRFKEGFEVGVVYSSTDIKMKKDKSIYPLLSFISELAVHLEFFLDLTF